jgi:hypothetical protein
MKTSALFLILFGFALTCCGEIALSHVSNLRAIDGVGPLAWSLETSSAPALKITQDCLNSAKLHPEKNKILDALMLNPESVRLATTQVIWLYGSDKRLNGLITAAAYFDLKNGIYWSSETDLYSAIRKRILEEIQKQ